LQPAFDLPFTAAPRGLVPHLEVVDSAPEWGGSRAQSGVAVLLARASREVMQIACHQVVIGFTAGETAATAGRSGAGPG
jgi:hypothetical protein